MCGHVVSVGQDRWGTCDATGGTCGTQWTGCVGCDGQGMMVGCVGRNGQGVWDMMGEVRWQGMWAYVCASTHPNCGWGPGEGHGP